MLPDDVTERILLGLAAFDLVRCKAVCKDWRSLISSADFVAAHLRRAKSDPASHHLLVYNRLFDLRGPLSAGTTLESLICFSSEDRMFDLPRPVAADPKDVLIVVGSANGLICVAGKADIPSPDDIWIFNPVTRLSLKLPYSDIPFHSDRNIKFAFWCDDDEDDGVYKVAKFLSNPNGETLLELWVSKSPDTWAVISSFRFHFHDFLHRHHAADVLIQGVAAYWICDHLHRYENPDYDGTENVIMVLSLNLKTLAMNKFVPPWYSPTVNKDYHWKVRTGNCTNSLLFGGNLNREFVLVAHGESGCYEFWYPVMDDTGAAINWIKKFAICLDSFSFKFCLGIVNDTLVGVAKRRFEDGVARRPFEREVGLCHLLTGILQVQKVSTIINDYAHDFVGSLVSIDGFAFKPPFKRRRMDIKQKNEYGRRFIEPPFKRRMDMKQKTEYGRIEYGRRFIEPPFKRKRMDMKQENEYGRIEKGRRFIESPFKRRRMDMKQKNEYERIEYGRSFIESPFKRRRMDMKRENEYERK